MGLHSLVYQPLFKLFVLLTLLVRPSNSFRVNFLIAVIQYRTKVTTAMLPPWKDSRKRKRTRKVKAPAPKCLGHASFLSKAIKFSGGILHRTAFVSSQTARHGEYRSVPVSIIVENSALHYEEVQPSTITITVFFKMSWRNLSGFAPKLSKPNSRFHMSR